MGTTLDMNDVPLVAAEHLARAMRHMVDSGKGLVLLRGLSCGDLRALEEAIWHDLDGDVVYRRAVLLRFQCMIDVFGARRLRTLLLGRGLGLMADALCVAARARLNANRGFSPLRFTAGLRACSMPRTAPRPALAAA